MHSHNWTKAYMYIQLTGCPFLNIRYEKRKGQSERENNIFKKLKKKKEKRKEGNKEGREETASRVQPYSQLPSPSENLLTETRSLFSLRGLINLYSFNSVNVN